MSSTKKVRFVLPLVMVVAAVVVVAVMATSQRSFRQVSMKARGREC
jgi:hypothetical protein